ncbi:hypothetical protein [Rhodovulum strictum]|uniref:Uncharacterized protein n=1 Tax=Rhodovulum strictum TaxID=58314 RepID=A0A844B5T6_9RHOB|nr:hypothetical protein [Rhodovulum strictum]MRH21736.1 hypothetical protein [Rhodovulum strictum]
MTGGLRPGEGALEGAPDPDGPRLRLIGRIRTPWGPGDCPKNIPRARETGRGATVELDPLFAPALSGLTVGQPVILLYPGLFVQFGRKSCVRLKAL